MWWELSTLTAVDGFFTLRGGAGTLKYLPHAHNAPMSHLVKLSLPNISLGDPLLIAKQVFGL